MEQFGHNLFILVYSWSCTLLVYLMPIILTDLILLNGRITRRLARLLGQAAEGIVDLIFRLIGTAFRSLGIGIWRGLRGTRKNQNRRRQ
ncbi:MAG: hypothetical protein WC460_02270 [Patescibacteria group bacterium]